MLRFRVLFLEYSRFKNMRCPTHFCVGCFVRAVLRVCVGPFGQMCMHSGVSRVISGTCSCSAFDISRRGQSDKTRVKRYNNV